MNDQQLIIALQGLPKQQDEAILWILDHWWGDMLTFIKSSGAEEQFIEDIAQEALTGLIKAVLAEKFKGDSSLLTYFKSIAKFKTIDYLKKYAQKTTTLDILPELPEKDDSPKKEAEEELVNLYYQLLIQLDEMCQKVLTFQKLGYSMKQIATKMGWGNQQSAKNKSSNCREKLRAIGEQNPVLMSKINDLL